MVIGVLGIGFVGNAVAQYMRNYFPVITYDVNPEKRTIETLEQFVAESSVIFACVPTPMKANGECDTSIVRQVVQQIDAVATRQTHVVIKSTVPPGTTASILTKNVNLIFNPEFLTEASAEQDFANQSHIVLGGEDVRFVWHVYRQAFPTARINVVKSNEAEMLKYVANTFLALKVAFSNEIYQLCEALEIDHSAVVGLAREDGRLGTTHWQVPGPDGQFGFGGTCFPKDINALLSMCQEHGVDSTILTAAWNKNLQVRAVKDWETLKGRAVV